MKSVFRHGWRKLLWKQLITFICGPSIPFSRPAEGGNQPMPYILTLVANHYWTATAKASPGQNLLRREKAGAIVTRQDFRIRTSSQEFACLALLGRHL
ncbi:hypothetical protein BCR43DRAFT_494762 [Syncephalastrum racemosum]|uniref:Uncharacterized protein n=1 Tax=Syncephalastrum racemosum TaxID=13706 RepID=A0A1X2H8N1_SYNRA|nr:hypothetical protein BCR43DRAFT_494762 [Syncephalastrum racemosum]